MGQAQEEVCGREEEVRENATGEFGETRHKCWSESSMGGEGPSPMTPLGTRISWFRNPHSLHHPN